MDNSQFFSEYFLFRLLINMATMVVLIRFIYHTIHAKRDLFFAFFLLNFIVFLFAFMMEKAKAFNSFGSAFGLMAAFSLLRFRTKTLTIKDMTYLFIIIAIGVINSVMKASYPEILTINIMIMVAVYSVDSNLLMRNHNTQTIEFNSLENIQPENEGKLLAELRQKTGLDIQKFSIEYIDFGKNKIIVKVYYY